MKKIFSTIGLVAIALVLSASLVAAVTPGQVPGPIVGTTGPTTITGWVDVLITVVRWIYTIIFIVAVLFILLAAFNFITSKGDAVKTGTAKKQLLYAIIGIAVALLSYGVVTLVQNSLQSGLAQ
ncbi:MAG TPA: hypothetical protein PK367_01935 [Candidatus Paceibacterota bacterium]|nr:hypothetical protein [Candidatus Paceibacterota bacterium]